ncbi:MAG: hypothetical protein ACXQT2_07030 [Methanotrichaceae archaeon]
MTDGMAIRVDRRLIGVAILTLLSLCLIGSTAFSEGAPQVNYLFSLGPYPGGTLKAVFQLQRSDEVTHYMTVEIVPNGDKYDVTETWSSPGQSADDLSSGPGMGGAARAVGASYETEQNANIDLSPINALADRNVELAPNQTYYLPDGARLTTQDWDEIAGIRVLRAIFLHPNFPNQRVQLGLTDPDTSALLSFPILMIKEVDGKVDQEIKLIELDYTP